MSRIRAQRGFVLIMALLFTTGLATLTAISITRSSTEVLAANHYVTQMRAFADAEAGIDCAIAQLRQNSDLGPAGANCTTATRTVTVQQEMNQPITIKTNILSGGVFVPTQIAAVERTTPSPFKQAAYGTMTTGPLQYGVFVSQGAFVDSYLSSAGVYGGANIRSNGDVRTNSPATGSGISAAIAVDNQSSSATTIYGAAYAPSGASIYVAPGGLSAITGGTPGPQTLTTFAAPVMPYSPTTPPSGCTTVSAITRNGGTEILDATCYIVTGDITVINGGQVTFSNATAVYVQGNITIGSGAAGNITFNRVATIQTDHQLAVDGVGSTLVGTSKFGPLKIYTDTLTVMHSGVLAGNANKPSKLQIYAMSPSENVVVGYGGTIYGTLYAPNSMVQMFSNTSGPWATVYGGVVANRVLVQMWSRLHYDEVLSAVATDWPTWIPAKVRVLAVGRNLQFSTP